MKKLNIIIVGYNEEKNLPKCFKSIGNFDDKIDLNTIYCDQSSTDNSLNIAKDFGISVRKHPQYGMGEFSRIEVVKKEFNNGDWLLFLDSDEEITKPLANEISRIVNNDECDIGILPIELYFMGKKTVTLKQPRLFKKGSMILQDIPHDALIPVSDKKKELRNKLINFDRKNDGYEMRNQLEKLNRYTSIEVEKIGKISRLTLFYGLFIKPVIWFFGFGIRWGYFFKGLPGRILAFYNASYQFFKYAKFYEKYYLKK